MQNLLITFETSKKNYKKLLHPYSLTRSANLNNFNQNTGHTQNNGADSVVFTIETAPFFCVYAVYPHQSQWKYSNAAIRCRTNQELKHPYGKKAALNKQLYTTHLEYANYLQESWFCTQSSINQNRG